MKSVSMGDKIELTALQLLLILNDTIEAAFEQALTENISPMVIANQKTKEIFNRKWATISEKEKGKEQ